MFCKNCQSPNEESDQFCANCGAKIVLDRLTIRKMFTEFVSRTIGLDNRVLQTVINLIRRPEYVLSSYIEGTRKRFSNPFAYFAIMAAIAVLVFNMFSEAYLDSATELSMSQMEMMEGLLNKMAESNPQIKAPATMTMDERIAWDTEQSENLRNGQSFMLKYMNVFAFLFLPIYGIMAFLVYRKPYNYAEHLVIASYLQGTSFLFSIIFLMLSIFISPSIFMFSLVLTMIFYLYSYSRLYRHSTGTIVVKLLKFIMVLILSFIALMLTAFFLGLAIAILR